MYKSFALFLMYILFLGCASTCDDFRSTSYQHGENFAAMWDWAIGTLHDLCGSIKSPLCNIDVWSLLYTFDIHDSNVCVLSASSDEESDFCVVFNEYVRFKNNQYDSNNSYDDYHYNDYY